MENNQTYITPKVGEVFIVDFDGIGSEQKGRRPAIVIQNNTANLYSPTVIVVPLTTATKKPNLPTHVLIDAESSGLKRNSMALCENTSCISKERLGVHVATLTQKHISEISEGCMLALSSIAYIDTERMLLIRERALKLNNIELDN